MEYLLNWNLGKEVNDLENPFVIALISYGIGNFCWAYILGKIFKKKKMLGKAVAKMQVPPMP